MTRDGKIDTIRTFCVLWVVLIVHMDEYANLDLSSPIISAVTKIVLAELFFISGWCVRNKEVNTSKQIFSFYCKKLKRLYPLYLIALLFLSVISYRFDFPYVAGRNNIIGGIFLVGAFVSPPIATLYFVNILMFFYVITPILKQDTKEKAIIVLIGTVTILIVLRQNIILGMDIRTIFYLPAYFLGVNYRLFSCNRNRNVIIGNTFALIIWIFAYSVFKENVKFVYKWLAEIMLVWVMCFFITTVFSPKSHKVVIKNRLMRVLVYSGYCIYLFHRVYYSILYYLFGEMSPMFAYVIAFPILIVLAYLIQLMYDSALNKLQKLTE